MSLCKFYVILFCVFFCTLSYSQNTNKQIIAKRTDFGLLYFIYPQTLCKSKTINCEFDQTIRTWSDTIDIGVTIGTKEVFKVDSLKIECKSGKMYLKADHLYTEKRKNRWGCRFFVHVPIAEIAKFFSDMPPFVCFYGNGKDISFGIKQKLWRKIFENNKNLYFQIELNK